MNTYGERLRAVMQARRLTQRQVADAIGTSQPTVSRILDGSIPLATTWDALCSAYPEMRGEVAAMIDQIRAAMQGGT